MELSTTSHPPPRLLRVCIFVANGIGGITCDSFVHLWHPYLYYRRSWMKQDVTAVGFMGLYLFRCLINEPVLWFATSFMFVKRLVHQVTVILSRKKKIDQWCLPFLQFWWLQNSLGAPNSELWSWSLVPFCSKNNWSIEFLCCVSCFTRMHELFRS